MTHDGGTEKGIEKGREKEHVIEGAMRNSV
jgi:hypothetical protein